MTTNSSDYATGNDNPMTEAQRVYLDNHAAQAGEPTPGDHLTKQEAARLIEELRAEAVEDIDPRIDILHDPNLDDNTNGQSAA